MNYVPLSAEQFGRTMIACGDLDPIYVMLNGAGLHPVKLARWCLSYWCFYHAGFASYCADTEGPSDFWDLMRRAADNKDGKAPTKDGRWPRGTERRHFRAAAAETSVGYLMNAHFTAPSAIHYLQTGSVLTNEGSRPNAPIPYATVRERVLKWPSFGPWIAFKVADMLDGVLGVPVDFEGTAPLFFDDPKAGAKLAWGNVEDLLGAPLTGLDYSPQNAVGVFLELMKDVEIPHLGRKIRTQEVETIFCKYKSHVNGRYPIGKDTHEILHGLQPWTRLSETAEKCAVVLSHLAVEQTEAMAA